MKLPEKGEKKVWESGALKEDSQGRGRYDLIPTRAKRRLAKRYEDGSLKYASRNWEKGIPFSKITDSLERHLDQWKEGDTTEDHLAAVAFWTFALMHFEEVNRKDLDDRPTYEV